MAAQIKIFSNGCDILLFNKDIEKICLYCEHAKENISGDDILCPFKGVVSFNFKCRRYKYDPLKREVRRAPHIEKPEDESFGL